jgi:hypothetical protein
MTVLCPNASEAERRRLPGGGARVALIWDPDHMHVVRESPTDRSGSQVLGRGDMKAPELEATRKGG